MAGSMNRTSRLLLCVLTALAASAPMLLAQQAATGKTPVQARSALKAAIQKGPGHATARCGDSTWSVAASQQGACSQHGGVATWFGAKPRAAAARCNDGQYWNTPERQGACTGHGGVATWYKKAGPSKAPMKKGA